MDVNKDGRVTLDDFMTAGAKGREEESEEERSSTTEDGREEVGENGGENESGEESGEEGEVPPSMLEIPTTSGISFVAAGYFVSTSI